MLRALALSALLVSAEPSAPDIAVSSPAVKSKAEPIRLHWDPRLASPQPRGAGPSGIPTIGGGIGMSEGKPLEMMLWGSGGAMAGSLAGPAGAMIGAAVGVAAGFLYSVYVVPHNGPKPAAKPK